MYEQARVTQALGPTANQAQGPGINNEKANILVFSSCRTLRVFTLGLDLG